MKSAQKQGRRRPHNQGPRRNLLEPSDSRRREILTGGTQNFLKKLRGRKYKWPKNAISQPKDGDFCCAIITDKLSTIKRLHHRLQQE
jgi:hypothetical protein